MRVEHAIIMAAGMSSRFVPLSYEIPKALVEVKGEILIERQIKQLQSAGVPSIIVVTGYKAEQLSYLSEKFPVKLIHNPEYNTRNNNGSLYVARDYLNNAYICSADNYFLKNPFEKKVSCAYYSLVYSDGPSPEWFVSMDREGWIDGVNIGGRDAWYMLGHAFFDEVFSKRFLDILLENYNKADYRDMLWESIFVKHLDQLKMKGKKYAPDIIFEFDSLDELRGFDSSYKEYSRSALLRQVAQELQCCEGELHHFLPLLDTNKQNCGFSFQFKENFYIFDYKTKALSLRK